VYRPGGSGALAKRGLEDGVGGDFVEGKIFGGAADALLPVEEEAAVAVGDAGGGIKRQKRWWGVGERGVWVRRVWL
jgi:hypothetical protein